MLSFLSFLISVTSWKALHVRGLYSIAEAWLNKLIRALAHAKHLDPLTHDSSSVRKTFFACRFRFRNEDHVTIPRRFKLFVVHIGKTYEHENAQL